ncbi:MAG: hypothetical protein AAFQ53_15690 [Bacteroidota bacterium]
MENSHRQAVASLEAAREMAQAQVDAVSTAYEAELQQARERIAALEGLLREVEQDDWTVPALGSVEDRFHRITSPTWFDRRAALLSGGDADGA